MTKYFTMMTVRVVCFVLMVVVQPYSWYTWLFAIGAVFLPYVAVVIANVASAPAERALPPERAIASGPADTASPEPAATGVIRIEESRPVERLSHGSPTPDADNHSRSGDAA